MKKNFRETNKRSPNGSRYGFSRNLTGQKHRRTNRAAITDDLLYASCSYGDEWGCGCLTLEEG
ncbi:15922_t:CDS:2 [Rhizophagus irregularis]|nr:15922_t:CDS:2 [Rhizophagus irregularis]